MPEMFCDMRNFKFCFFWPTCISCLYIHSVYVTIFYLPTFPSAVFFKNSSPKLLCRIYVFC